MNSEDSAYQFADEYTLATGHHTDVVVHHTGGGIWSVALPSGLMVNVDELPNVYLGWDDNDAYGDNQSTLTADTITDAVAAVQYFEIQLRLGGWHPDDTSQFMFTAEDGHAITQLHDHFEKVGIDPCEIGLAVNAFRSDDETIPPLPYAPD